MTLALLVHNSTINHLLSTWGYAVVFGFIAIESLGIPFPGETTLTLAAIYAGDTHKLSIVGIVAAAAAGAIVGDNVGYTIGRFGGYRLLCKYGHYIRVDERRIKIGRYLFDHQGGKVVFFGRFVSILRTYAAFLAGTMQMHWLAFLGYNATDGVTRAACLLTSAYSSYSGCRQYRENLADAVAQVPGAPRLDRLRHYFNHPGFIEPNVDATLAALAALPDSVRREAHLVFVTHSIPEAMNAASGPIGDAYVHQHRSVMDEISDRVREETGHRYPAALVYCSRSGPPSVPWLEPDVNDHLRSLHEREVPAAVIIPIGFVSDHMEVVYDLDTEAMATARELGMACERAATAGVDPRFVAMARDLLLERAAVERGEDPPRAAMGTVPPAWDVCAAGCCANPRGPRPALCGSD